MVSMCPCGGVQRKGGGLCACVTYYADMTSKEMGKTENACMGGERKVSRAVHVYRSWVSRGRVVSTGSGRPMILAGSRAQMMKVPRNMYQTSKLS